ncbi:MAG: hypothetical protein DRI84_07910 [Bacteroidetes bacterium]|nr:MAG: hypothetical protein DRI84_07910 [Bacteroidota bacterium]
MTEAIRSGTKKMDHFDIPRLNELYEGKGFREIKREPNWTQGEPDMVFRERQDTAFEKLKNMIKRKP